MNDLVYLEWLLKEEEDGSDKLVLMLEKCLPFVTDKELKENIKDTVRAFKA